MQRQPPDLKPIAMQATQAFSPAAIDQILPEPLIIVSAPRSGSTLVFEQLIQLEGMWSIGGESHAIFREFPMLRAENGALDSMTLGRAHAPPQIADLFKRLFLLFARDHHGQRYFDQPPAQRPAQLQLIEKTPRNALNIPFLLEVFPTARFLFLHRAPREGVASLIEAWTLGLQTGRFVTFRGLPDWHLPGWCFLLPRGWRDLKGKSIAEIAAFQWTKSNEAIMAGLSDVPRERWTSLNYQSFLDDPTAALQNVLTFLGSDRQVQALSAGNIPLSRTTVSQPSPDKWRRYEAEITPLLPKLEATQAAIEAFCT